MKLLFSAVFLTLIFGCCKDDDDVEITAERCATENFGLSINNKFPYFPNTDPLRGTNGWGAKYVGDTLLISRTLTRGTDDSNVIEYRFIAKKGQCLEPISAELKYYTAMWTEDEFENMIGIPPRVWHSTPLRSFKIQHYQEHQLLACIVEHVDGWYRDGRIKTEKMWIELP